MIKRKHYKNALRTLLTVVCILLISGCFQQKKFSKPGLSIYQSPNIIGYNDKPIIVANDFIPSMNQINQYAKENNLTVYVTSSYRNKNDKVKNSIVKPANFSNHYIGHAIDMNLEYKDQWFNSTSMKTNNFKNLPKNIKCFLSAVIKNPNLRWGGTFQREDPVHIDDNYNSNKIAWKEKFYQLKSLKTSKNKLPIYKEN